MASRAKVIATTDHDKIRQWAEERGARPACVRGTGGNDDVGMIRLDFPGFSDEGSLEEISWDDWFRSFDENGLALLHQETTAGGQKGNFNKLVARETAEDRQSSRHGARGSGTRSSRTRGRSESSREGSTGARRRSTGARNQSGTSAHRSGSRQQKGSRNTRANRSTRGGSRRATMRVRATKSSSSTRRGGATTRGRRQSTTARGSAKSNKRSRSTRSSSRARGGRATSRQTNARGGRSARGNVIAMKKTTRNRRRVA